MNRRTKNPLLAPEVPEILRHKIFELAALDYRPLSIAIMLEDMYSSVKITDHAVADLLNRNKEKVALIKQRMEQNPKTRIPSREALINRVSILLDVRFRQALNDFLYYIAVSEEYRNTNMTEKQFKRRTEKLYLPSSIELSNLIVAIDKRLTPAAQNAFNKKNEKAPTSTGEPIEEQTPPPEIDEKLKAKIEEARARGDMVELQRLIYQLPKPSTVPPEKK